MLRFISLTSNLRDKYLLNRSTRYSIYIIGSVFVLLFNSRFIPFSTYNPLIKISAFAITLNAKAIFFSDFNRIDVNYLDQKDGFIYKTDSRGVVLQLKYSFNRKMGKNKDVKIDASESSAEENQGV